MFLALAHLKDFADGPFVDQLADALVFRRETEFLGIHQFPVRRAARRDHIIRLLQVQGKRLFDDDMLASPRRGQHSAVVQKVRQANVCHIAAGFSNRLVEVVEATGDAVFFRERFRAVRLACEDTHDLRVRDKAVIRFDVDVGDETDAEQGDFGSAHRKFLPDSAMNSPGSKLTFHRALLCCCHGNEKPPAVHLPEALSPTRSLELRACFENGRGRPAPDSESGAGRLRYQQPIFKHALTSHLDQSMRGSGRSVPWSARDTYRACPWGAFPYPPPARRRKRPMGSWRCCRGGWRRRRSRRL